MVALACGCRAAGDFAGVFEQGMVACEDARVAHVPSERSWRRAQVHEAAARLLEQTRTHTRTHSLCVSICPTKSPPA